MTTPTEKPLPCPWVTVKKTDPRCRALADRHYTRQSVGAVQFTRPGFNYVLWAPDACLVWWRPKWESGIMGTERKDRLRCLECTLFRNESKMLSSEMILAAEKMLDGWDRANDVPIPDGLVTAVGVPYTAKRRGKRSRPGECFLRAGWDYFGHPTSQRDDLVWLHKPFRQTWSALNLRTAYYDDRRNTRTEVKP